MKKIVVALSAFIIMFALTSSSSCDVNRDEPKSESGVTKTSVKVQTDANGLTVEQKQVSKRLLNDNKPGAIKHLYVISPYSGQVILYSTVDGKVTSSGKRLTPTTVAASDDQYNGGIPVMIGGRRCWTNEVLQDDGTYGTSDPYIFWFDVRGVYHQHFMTGGQIIHVADQPLNVKSVIINIEADAK